jgi:2-methylcitrate dehydratase
MKIVEQLADFVVRASFDDLSIRARQQLKIRVLDALGCAIGAMDGKPIGLIRDLVQEFAGAPLCTLIGGGRTAPDRAAFYNSALVRYLDFNDSYLAKGETCHPSDNLGAVLAAAEYTKASGREVMTALAVAYQVQCRLSDEAPVRDKGFDHTTQGSYAVAAGVSKALKLDRAQTANAIAIAGTAFNALRATRTGPISHWKGLAYPNTAFASTHAVFLAKRGITGPLDVFEGNKGFMEAITGPFVVDWASEDLERVTRTIVKRYNAEIHSQSAVEGILGLRQAHDLEPQEVDMIEVDIFDVAYHIIGGGEEGAKTEVHTKEEADHSLPYILAVALLDGEVTPKQYLPQRIEQDDVQNLLRKVRIRPSPVYSDRFPEQMACRLRIVLKDGREFVIEKRDYEGFVSRPMTWKTVSGKFDYLSRPYAPADLRRQITAAVAELETIQISELMNLLAQVKSPGQGSEK